MTIIDLLIGITLMNAMIHLVLGFWKGRMLTPFGYGNKQNIIYSMLSIGLSIGLFIYRYGADHFFKNGIYVGALTVLLIFFVFGKFLYKIVNKKKKK